MIEVLSIPLGILAGDSMLKAAQVDIITAQTVCAGKYIVIVSGEVAAAKSALNAGVEMCGNALVDSMLIPNIDRSVLTAISGSGAQKAAESVGIMETFSLTAAIQAADAAVKAADIEIIEIRLGRGMGGKSFVVITGDVAAVQAADKAAKSLEAISGMVITSVVIPSIHEDMIRALL
jgi:microcompartment protein CcmL/EutN